MSDKTPQILVVEDDQDLINITKIYLSQTGYDIDVARDCAEAAQKINQKAFDLVLLDFLLPDGDGSSLCPLIHQQLGCPIIFISCLDDSDTIVAALNSGGDDYVVKPIKYDELLARIEANLRRASLLESLRGRPGEGNLIRLNNLKIDTQRRCVLLQGEEVSLSSIEYELLLHMVENRDTLLLYDDLYHHVWRNDSFGDVRTVMVHISNLRKKIDPDKTGLIETVRGAGYIFSDV